MKTYLRKIVAFINDEEGASAIEYGLLVAIDRGGDRRGGDCPGRQAQRFVHGGITAGLLRLELAGHGAGASGLRPLSYEGNQSCRGHSGMQPQRPAPTLGAEPDGVMGYRAPDHGLFGVNPETG